MEINQIKSAGLYQKNVSGKSIKTARTEPATTTTSVARHENSDKLELSSEASQQYEVYRITKSVMSQMDEEGSAQRVEELRAGIKNGTYHVPTEALADKLLSRLEA